MKKKFRKLAVGLAVAGTMAGMIPGLVTPVSTFADEAADMSGQGVSDSYKVNIINEYQYTEGSEADYPEVSKLVSDKETAVPGETVTVTFVRAAGGLPESRIKVIKSDSGEDVTENVLGEHHRHFDEDTLTFTMPEYDITIKAGIIVGPYESTPVFAFSDKADYRLASVRGSENGKVTVEAESLEKSVLDDTITVVENGDTVHLTAVPDPGYKFKKWYISCPFCNVGITDDMEINTNVDETTGVATADFVQNGNVWIEAEFEKEASDVETGDPLVIVEPVLNIIQAEGGSISAGPIKTVTNIDGDYIDAYELPINDKDCKITAKADDGWYFKKWIFDYNEDKGSISSPIPTFHEETIEFHPDFIFGKDGFVEAVTYGTANVSAVFEQLKEGEYAVYTFITDENIAVKAGEKVTMPYVASMGTLAVYKEEYQDGALIEYEVDESLQTFSFIMPESDVYIGYSIVKAADPEFEDENIDDLSGHLGDNSDGNSESVAGEVQGGKNTGTDDGSKEDHALEKDDSVSDPATGEGDGSDKNDDTNKGDDTIRSEGVKKTAQPATGTAKAAGSVASSVTSGSVITSSSAPVTKTVSTANTVATSTGDKAHTSLWIAVAAGTVIATLGTVVLRRKKRNE